MSHDNGNAAQATAPSQPSNQPPKPCLSEFVSDIGCCKSCRQAHFRVPVKPYSSLHLCAPFTHFYVCPTNQEPCNMAIIEANGQRLQIHDRAMRDLFENQTKPGTLFATFTTGPTADKLNCTVHQHEFNSANYDAAVMLLDKTLGKMRPIKPTSEPLPAAGKERFAMFGPQVAAAINNGPQPPQELAVATQPITTDAAPQETKAAETPPRFDEETTGDQDGQSDEE